MTCEFKTSGYHTHAKWDFFQSPPYANIALSPRPSNGSFHIL